MKFRYSGPTSGVTLRVGESQTEVMLFDGSEVELPEAHDYTKTLVALGHLTPVADETPVKTAKSKGEQ
jgi:hypothetical protein